MECWFLYYFCVYPFIILSIIDFIQLCPKSLHLTFSLQLYRFSLTTAIFLNNLITIIYSE